MKYIDLENIYEVRASKDTYPKNLANSVSNALMERGIVKLSGVGDALKTMLKALAILERYNATGIRLYYKPISEQVSTEINTCNVVSVIISMEDNINLENEDDSVIVTDCLNNRQLIERSIRYYKKLGYNLATSIPINKDGVTSYIYLVYEK